MSTVDTSYSQGSSSAAGNTLVASNGAMDDPSKLFTTLLVAQIRNQNPLEPTDPSEFVGQLTQLTQMESLQNLASQASANAAMLESLQVLALGAQVGSQLTVATDTVTLGDEAVSGRFILASGAKSVTVVLTQAGQEQRIELGARNAGAVDFTLDPADLGLAAGSYSIRVETDSGESPTVGINAALQSVRLSASGGVVLQAAGLGDVPTSAILGFNGRGTNQSS